VCYYFFVEFTKVLVFLSKYFDMPTPEPQVTKAELDKYNKPDLQAKYKEVLGIDADESLTKAALSEAILEKIAEGDNGGQSGDNGGTGNDPEKDKLPTPEPQVTTTGVLKLVKLEGGNVIDRTTMPKKSWDLLPQHKYGWTIEKPAELKS
jgi:hypothetical protein